MRLRVLASLLVFPAALRAQAATTVTPPCTGQIAIVRTSELTGPMQRFMEAAADHERWYRTHGVSTNRIVSAPVYELKGDAWVQDTTKVLSLHINPPSKNPPSDAEWTRFSEKYASVSKILTRTVACLPKGM